jgi:hypothetical protein
MGRCAVAEKGIAKMAKENMRESSWIEKRVVMVYLSKQLGLFVHRSI